MQLNYAEPVHTRRIVSMFEAFEVSLHELIFTNESAGSVIQRV